MFSVFENGSPGLRHWVTAPDGVGVEVREWGDPGGPALVLITGVAQSYLSFVRQYTSPEFQRFRVISYDPRGHGVSDKPMMAEAYEGRAWSGEVAAIIAALGLHRPVIAGWSLGGRILRQYLIDYGDAALGGVAFISCRPVEVPEVVGPGNAVLPTVDLANPASRIGVALAFLRNCFGLQPSADELAFMLGYNVMCPWEIRQLIGKWLTPVAVSEDALRRVRVPALVAHGKDDILVLPRAGEMTASLIPHARTSWFAGCGHSAFFEDHVRFNRELADFVSAAVATSGAPRR